MSEQLFTLLIKLLDNIFIDFERKSKTEYIFLSSVHSLKKAAYQAIANTNDTDPIDPLELACIFDGAKSLANEIYNKYDSSKFSQLIQDVDDLYDYLYDAVLVSNSYDYFGEARERDMDQDRSRCQDDWER